MSRETLQLLPAWLFLAVLPFTHTVALRLTTLFVAAAVAGWMWFRHPSRARIAVAGWPWLLFWAVTPIVLVPFSVDVPYSLAEVKAEIGYAVLAFFTFFVLGRSERALDRSLKVLFATALLLATWVVVDRYRVGVWNEANYFGGRVTVTAYLITVAPLGVLIARKRIFGGATIWLLAAFSGLSVWIGFLSEQRGFWIALTCQVLCFFALLRRFSGSEESRRKALIPAILIIGLAAVAVVAAGARFTHTSHIGALLEDPRLRHWDQVISWIASRPLTGYGFGRGMMPKAFPEVVGGLGQFWHAHNVVLNYGFQLGVPGVVAVLGAFWALFANWKRVMTSSDPVLKAVAMSGALIVVGVFTRNMTNDVFQRDLSLLFWALTGLLMGYAQALRNRT